MAELPNHITDTLRGKTIIIAVLNWGLGHATRMVPVIEEALLVAQKVVIASDGEALEWLKLYFPKVKTLELPSYNITYSLGWRLKFKLLTLLPQMAQAIQEEHRIMGKYIADINVDLVISDNRLGCFHPTVKSVYITHQLRLMPGSLFSGIATFMHQYYYHRFKEIWVPDYQGQEQLSGALSHQIKVKVPLYYVGPLSRFMKLPKPKPKCTTEKVNVILLSGPESARIQYLKELQPKWKESHETWIILGKVKSTEIEFPQQVRIMYVVQPEEFLDLLISAHKIYSRIGYTTLMDMHYLGLSPVFSPTPGQPEQEYLFSLKNF